MNALIKFSIVFEMKEGLSMNISNVTIKRPLKRNTQGPDSQKSS